MQQHTEHCIVLRELYSNKKLMHLFYTSVSPALNQNVSVNAKAKEPTKALPKTATALFFPTSLMF